jgi:NADH:ubiquinone oxidoreductase subunit 4 (subunit M)
MKDKPQIMNNIHGTTLIGAGLASYQLNEKRPVTALIPAVAGVSLLLMSKEIEKGNQTVAHVAVGLTGLLLVQTSRMFLQAALPDEETEFKFDSATLQRRTLVFGLMSVTGIAALSIYIAGFIEKRKNG